MRALSVTDPLSVDCLPGTAPQRSAHWRVTTTPSPTDESASGDADVSKPWVPWVFFGSPETITGGKALTFYSSYSSIRVDIAGLGRSTAASSSTDGRADDASGPPSQ
jgi:hypothetical protein